MKYTVTLITLLCLIQTGFSQKIYSTFIDHDKDFTLINNEFFGGRDSLITNFYENGSIQSKGKYAIDSLGKLSSLKIGYWTDYYPNGVLRSTGNYQISSYLDCGIAGLERFFYNYKFGEWIYYYQDFSIEAKGTYKLIHTKIDTRCKGGDKLIFMTTSKNWIFPNSQTKSRNLDMTKYVTISDDLDHDFKIQYTYDTKHKKVIMKFGNDL